MANVPYPVHPVKTKWNNLYRINFIQPPVYYNRNWWWRVSYIKVQTISIVYYLKSCNERCCPLRLKKLDPIHFKQLYETFQQSCISSAHYSNLLQNLYTTFYCIVYPYEMHVVAKPFFFAHTSSSLFYDFKAL